MPPQVAEWSNLILRWFHVASAILWVGSTYSFVKLARLLAKPDPQAKDAAAPAWVPMGGEVLVARQRDGQPLVPAKQFSFRWEALATWLSGFLLLGLLYYSGGLLLYDDSPLRLGVAVGIGIGTLFVGWIVYDLLWISPLGRIPIAAGLISMALFVALAWELCRLFTGRAAFIHIGALLGTILTLNLLMRIIPAQRKIAAALSAGQAPDPSWGARARLRSRHNLLIVVPVIFLMISNHFPLTYGNDNNWIILSLLVFAGAVAGKGFFGV